MVLTCAMMILEEMVPQDKEFEACYRTTDPIKRTPTPSTVTHPN